MCFMLPYLLAMVAVTWGSMENINAAEEVNLPTPRIYGISRYSEKGPIIHWLIDDKSEDNPVMGYKVKLWQVGCDKKPKYKIVDGERVRLKNVMPKLRDYSTLRNLTEFTLEGKNNTALFLKDIEPDVPYHMTVAAHGAGEKGDDEHEGPPSSPFRFQFRGRYTCREILPFSYTGSSLKFSLTGDGSYMNTAFSIIATPKIFF